MIYFLVLTIWYLSAQTLLLYAYAQDEVIDWTWINLAFILGPVAWVFMVCIGLYWFVSDVYRKRTKNDADIH